MKEYSGTIKNYNDRPTAFQYTNTARMERVDTLSPIPEKYLGCVILGEHTRYLNKSADTGPVPGETDIVVSRGEGWGTYLVLRGTIEEHPLFIDFIDRNRRFNSR